MVRLLCFRFHSDPKIKAAGTEAVVSGQWSVVSGQWSVGSWQLPVVSDRASAKCQCQWDRIEHFMVASGFADTTRRHVSPRFRRHADTPIRRHVSLTVPPTRRRCSDSPTRFPHGSATRQYSDPPTRFPHGSAETPVLRFADTFPPGFADTPTLRSADTLGRRPPQ